MASLPSTDAMKARNCLAASMLAVVLGMYVAAGIQIVAPLVAASSPGCPKKPMSSIWSGKFSAMVPTAKVSIG